MLCRSEYDVATYFSADKKSWYLLQQLSSDQSVFIANNEDNEGPSMVVDTIATLGPPHPYFHSVALSAHTYCRLFQIFHNTKLVTGKNTLKCTTEVPASSAI